MYISVAILCKKIFKITVTLIGHTMTNPEAETHPQEVRRDPDQPLIMMMTSSHVTCLLETSRQFQEIKEPLPRSFLLAQSIFDLRMTRMCLPPRSQRRRTTRRASLHPPDIPLNLTNVSHDHLPPDLVIVSRIPSLLLLPPISLETGDSLRTPRPPDIMMTIVMLV